MDEHGRSIEARYLARRQAAPALFMGALAAVCGLLLYADPSSWWLRLAVIEFAVATCFLVLVTARVRRSGWVLRLDEGGVTVRGAEPVPWSDLTHVTLGPIAPWPAVTTTRWTRILALVPRPGVELPGPPHHRGRPQEWGRSIRRRFYRTNLTMLPHALSVPTEELLDACRDWGGLEVRRARQPRPWLAVLLLALFCVAVGALAVVVDRLV